MFKRIRFLLQKVLCLIFALLSIHCSSKNTESIDFFLVDLNVLDRENSDNLQLNATALDLDALDLPIFDDQYENAGLIERPALWLMEISLNTYASLVFSSFVPHSSSELFVSQENQTEVDEQNVSFSSAFLSVPSLYINGLLDLESVSKSGAPTQNLNITIKEDQKIVLSARFQNPAERITITSHQDGDQVSGNEIVISWDPELCDDTELVLGIENIDISKLKFKIDSQDISDCESGEYTLDISDLAGDFNIELFATHKIKQSEIEYSESTNQDHYGAIVRYTTSDRVSLSK